MLELISHDPNNTEANQLLRTIRAQHQQQQTASTPVSKALEALQKAQTESNEKEVTHNLKILLGLLDNDVANASTEFGRVGGVAFVLELVQQSTSTTQATTNSRNAILATQCLSSAAAHPVFVRMYLAATKLQTQLGDLVTAVLAAQEQLAEAD